jgi:signal transduction histidine kinase
MSHEIRTPLNAVLGYLTQADASETTEEMSKNVRKSGRMKLAEM